MTLRGTFATTALALPLAFATAVSATSPSAPRSPAPATYGIDTVHSSALFRIQHFGAGFFHGRFDEISGTVAFDEANPAACSVDVTIKADSVDTKEPKRDTHLKGPDFFNAAEFPTLTFKSKSVKAAGKGEYEVTGDLTIHGVTKTLTVKVAHTGTGKGQSGEVVGFETVFTIKRSDFGMKFMHPQLGDEVRVTLALEAGKK